MDSSVESKRTIGHIIHDIKAICFTSAKWASFLYNWGSVAISSLPSWFSIIKLRRRWRGPNPSIPQYIYMEFIQEKGWKERFALCRLVAQIKISEITLTMSNVLVGKLNSWCLKYNTHLSMYYTFTINLKVCSILSH